MAVGRVGGKIFVAVDGTRLDAKGSFTYNLGRDMREAVVGHDRTHGYKETPQVAFIEGEITHSSSLDMDQLVQVTGATVTLELANGKTFVLRDAWFAGEGSAATEEGNITVRYEGLSADIT